MALFISFALFSTMYLYMHYQKIEKKLIVYAFRDTIENQSGIKNVVGWCNLLKQKKKKNYSTKKVTSYFYFNF